MLTMREVVYRVAGNAVEIAALDGNAPFSGKLKPFQHSHT